MRTWGYVKLATLQLMFANEGATLRRDDNTEEYINAMPMAANQALGEIFILGMPLLRQGRIRVTRSADQAGMDQDGCLLLPVGSGQAAVDLPVFFQDFRAVDAENVWRVGGSGSLERTADYDLMGGRVLLLPDREEGEWLVWYRAYPLTITQDLSDETPLEIPDEAADIMPLYMAGELYKDDDLTASVQFLNEFQQKLTMLQVAAGQQKAGASVSSVRNTTGWW